MKTFCNTNNYSNHGVYTNNINPWTPKTWKMKVLNTKNMGYNPKQRGCGLPSWTSRNSSRVHSRSWSACRKGRVPFVVSGMSSCGVTPREFSHGNPAHTIHWSLKFKHPHNSLLSCAKIFTYAKMYTDINDITITYHGKNRLHNGYVILDHTGEYRYKDQQPITVGYTILHHPPPYWHGWPEGQPTLLGMQ